MDEVEAIVESIRAAVSANRKVLLAFDFDGTLSPLAPNPDLAHVPCATHENLHWLSKAPNITIAVVSGRPLSQLEDYFPKGGIWFAGSGGLVVKIGDRVSEFPAINYINSLLTDVALRLTVLCEKFKGTWLEVKPGTMTIHFRDLSVAHRSGLMKGVAYIIAVEEKLESLVATQAIEIRPRCGWHKGTAVEIMRQELWNSENTSPFIAYFGDSANDREAVDAANRYGGISVGIGRESPASCLFKLSSPVEVEETLRRICRLVPPPQGEGESTLRIMCA